MAVPVLCGLTAALGDTATGVLDAWPVGVALVAAPYEPAPEPQAAVRKTAAAKPPMSTSFECIAGRSLLRSLADEIPDTKNLARERAIPYTAAKVAQKDWTDTLLDRLAVNHSREDVEPYRFRLNRGEVGVLGALLLAGSAQLSPTQLFKGLMLSSAGITSRLDRLERAGYVKRTRHPQDRRGVLVSLTPAGRKVFEQAFAADLKGEKDLMAPLTKAEQRSLVSLLRKLLSALEPPEPRPDGGDA